MTKNLIRGLALSAGLLVATSLSGCVSGPALVPAGAYAPGDTAHLTLDRDWSDVTKLFARSAPKVKVLSIDSFVLNRLYVSDGLGASDPLIISPAQGDTSAHPAPRGKADMSLSEQMEFVSRAVGELDYQKVETSNPQPVKAGDAHGVRFEITARTTDGLNMRGLAQVVNSKGLSYYVIYLAPAEHYYDASLKNATAVMDSLKLPA